MSISCRLHNHFPKGHTASEASSSSNFFFSLSVFREDAAEDCCLQDLGKWRVDLLVPVLVKHVVLFSSTTRSLKSSDLVSSSRFQWWIKGRSVSWWGDNITFLLFFFRLINHSYCLRGCSVTVQDDAEFSLPPEEFLTDHGFLVENVSNAAYDYFSLFTFSISEFFLWFFQVLTVMVFTQAWDSELALMNIINGYSNHNRRGRWSLVWT